MKSSDRATTIFSYKTKSDAPLSNKSVKKIAAILESVWAVPTSVKAAMELRKAGFSSYDLWRFGKTETARLQPGQWRNNTYNELRNFEIDNPERL